MATKIRLLALYREIANKPFACDYCQCKQGEGDKIIVRADTSKTKPVTHKFCSMDCHDEWETENYGTLYGI